MHEWALAEAVISAISETAKKEGLKKIIEVDIKVGELQQIELDILEFAFSQLIPQELKNAKFKIGKVKAKLKCRACDHQWAFARRKLDKDTAEAVHYVPEVAHAYIKCPKCGSPDFEILAGRGLWLESVKGVR